MNSERQMGVYIALSNFRRNNLYIYNPTDRLIVVTLTLHDRMRTLILRPVSCIIKTESSRPVKLGQQVINPGEQLEYDPRNNAITQGPIYDPNHRRLMLLILRTWDNRRLLYMENKTKWEEVIRIQVRGRQFNLRIPPNKDVNQRIQEGPCRINSTLIIDSEPYVMAQDNHMWQAAVSSIDQTHESPRATIMKLAMRAIHYSRATIKPPTTIRIAYGRYDAATWNEMTKILESPKLTEDLRRSIAALINYTDSCYPDQFALNMIQSAYTDPEIQQILMRAQRTPHARGGLLSTFEAPMGAQAEASTPITRIRPKIKEEEEELNTQEKATTPS